MGYDVYTCTVSHAHIRGLFLFRVCTQCRVGRGACPDTVDTTTGGTCTNDISDVSGFIQEGQQCISFTRPFNPCEFIFE